MTSDRGTSGEAELQLDTPVTPKSPHGLNPNASEFQCHKTSIPVTVANNTDLWEDNNRIVNNMSSVSECAFNVNGDVTWENAEVIYSFPEEQPYMVNEANLDMKLEEMLVLDNTSTDYHMPLPGIYGVEGTGIQYNSDDRIESDVQLTDGNLPEDQLRHNVKSQLESLFSRENLSNDSYLQSQMDADQYVPVTTVANLEQIQSNFVHVDEKGEKVRPNHNRRIVILREIPDSTPIEEVQNLFSGEKCPKFVSCEFAHNDNWYVTFVSDVDAQHAYQYLREVVKTFQGKPIMARIKAKPLIPTYQPRNGPIKPFQPPSVTPAQIPPEIVTSTHQPQFAASQPFTLINHVSQYLNGQQAIPFYPPQTSQLLPNWHGHIMEPSMVLAMNGYHATNVKVNNMTNNRNHPFNINRSNNRNPKFHGGPPMGRDRINSNESLPPRLQHQHDRQHMHAISNSIHKPDSQISNHGAQFYNSRRGDGNSGSLGIGGHGASNHTGYVSHNHHGSMASHNQHNHQQQQLDGNNNSHQLNSAINGAVVNSRTQLPPSGSDTSQRFSAGKSYKSRRRREEDIARSNRSASQPSHRDGTPAHLSADKFDYEPTSFPPLPGAESNKSSNEVFESKLSDVVKGTAKQQIKEAPPAKLVISQSTVVSSASPGLTVTTPTKSTTITTTSKTSLSSDKDIDASVGCSTSQQTVSVPSTTALLKPSSGVTSSDPPQISVTVRSVKPVQTVPENKPTIDRLPKQLSLESLTNSDDKNASSKNASSAKPSYAEMVQRSKAIEVSANSLADSDDSENTDNSTQPSSHALKEQEQQQNQSRQSANRSSSAKEFVRKNSRESYDRRFDREREKDMPKESDCHRGEPREQRSNRRLKENREQRFCDREGAYEKRDNEETKMECDESKEALEK